MAISFGGMASGLPPNIVDMIIQADRKPIDLIQNNKANQENKLKLLGELKNNIIDLNTTLGSMASFASLRELKARSSSEDILTVTVDKKEAKPGIYTLKVEQLAKRASAITNGFPDKDKTEVGIGYIVFDVDGKEREIFIGEDNNTLEGIVAAIQGSGLPIRASIVHDEAADKDAQYRLILATEGEGTENNFNFPNFYFMDGDIDFFIDDESLSQNGRIMLDGFPITTKSNKITQVVPGATINILDANPKKNVSIIIEEDIESVGEKVEAFVTKTNKVLDFFESQFAVNESTDTSKTLAGDTSLQTLQFAVRRMLQDTVPGLTGNVKSLGDVGISFNRTGRLEFNKEKFSNAANNDFKGVSDLFSANHTYINDNGDTVKMEGVVTRLYERFKQVLYGDGIVSIKEKAFFISSDF